MKPLRALLVDDEAPARRRLARMLQRIPDVDVVGEAADGDGAVEEINALKPDVVFLDVRMPRMDGISLAYRYAPLPPTIFVTAHAAFAVRAFEVNAVDYLLKPLNLGRLAAAVERVRAKAGGQPAVEALAPASGSRVVTLSRGVIRFFDARELTRLWASEKYTVFSDGTQEHLTLEPLNELERRLAPFGFLRVHRAELINLRKVRALRSQDGDFELELTDGQRAKVSRRSITEVKRALTL